MCCTRHRTYSCCVNVLEHLDSLVLFAIGIAAGGGASTDSDVVAALESLGYTASEARRAAGAVAGGDDGLDLRIKAALQELARNR